MTTREKCYFAALRSSSAAMLVLTYDITTCHIPNVTPGLNSCLVKSTQFLYTIFHL